MSEIEKMYKNAGVYDFRYTCDVLFADGDFGRITNCSKGEIKDYCTDKKYFLNAKVIDCGHLYPPFTAEKQLKILCFIVNNKHSVTFHDQVFSGDRLTLEKIQENLAWAINRMWQSLTPEEKQQVKGILE